MTSKPSAATEDVNAVAGRALRLTHAGLVLERGLRAFWAAGALIILALSLRAFGLFDLLAARPRFWLTLAIWFVVAVALGFGMRRFRWPSSGEALQRLDLTLPGRPLSALQDSPAIGEGDPAAMELWQAHRRQMASRAATARPVPPSPDLAPRDPYGLRLIALTAGAVAVLFAQPRLLSDLPGAPGPAGAAFGPVWEGWVTPPRYTGRPTLYLNEIDVSRFEVPQGSELMLRLYGDVSVSQSLGGEETRDETGQILRIGVMESGPLSVGGREWQLDVSADNAPSVTLVGATERGRGGVMTQSFRASDDFGVQRGVARITLDEVALDRRFGLALEPEPREPLLIDLPMPMAGSRAEISDVLREDLAEHPWAHLPVVMVLEVEDAAGQVGATAPRHMALPARRFFEPAARAVAELRRDLLWSGENARRVAQILRAMLYDSESEFVVEIAPAMMREAVRIIEVSLADGTWDAARRDEMAAFLWELSLSLEEGELANARERLRRAQERLDQAMRNGASQAEIAELMDELREATRDYMAMLAEQIEDSPDQADQRDRGGEGETMSVSNAQIQELMNEIQRLMEEGQMDEAAALMAQLNELLANLQMQRGQGGEGESGDPSLSELGETLGEQQRLADETFRELQRQFQEERGRGQGEQPSGENRAGGKDELPAPNTPEEQGSETAESERQDGAGEGEGERAGAGGDEELLEELADRQESLREQLRRQQLGDFPGAGTDDGEAGLEALEDAERAMDQAVDALRQGDARGALERQAEALEAMREGLRRMREGSDRDRAEAERESDAPSNEQGQGAGRDPLGRQQGGEGQLGGDGGIGSLEDPRSRARDLMDEIRRRLAERERPEAERDYLDRLIERF